MAFLACGLGLAFGAAEFFFTALLVRAMLEKSPSSRMLWVALGKLAVYAGAIALGMLWLRANLLPYGLGFGLGMLISAGVNFFLERK